MTAGLPRAYEQAIATVTGVLTDLSDLAGHLAGQPLPITAGQAEHAAAILGRLAQECAEAAYLITASEPGGHPSLLPAYTLAATAVIADAVAREHDFGGWLAIVLTMAAARRGSSAALVARRPGSWEAVHVLRLVRGTAGEQDEHLGSYRDRS